MFVEHQAAHTSVGRANTGRSMMRGESGDAFEEVLEGSCGGMRCALSDIEGDAGVLASVSQIVHLLVQHSQCPVGLH